MVRQSTRMLLWLLAAGYAALGVVLFCFPAWSAAQFAWRVEPAVAMTVGGWCIGNAVYAWFGPRNPRWPHASLLILYLSLFGIAQALVAWSFRGALRWQGVLTWPYLILLGATVVLAIVALTDWIQTNEPRGGQTPMQWWERSAAVFFVAFVAFLAYRGSIAQAGGLSTEGGIFPTKLTLFSVRAFAAFYAALALSALPAVWMRTTDGWHAYIRAGLWLIYPITGAALLNLGLFDFAQRPGGWFYLGAYIAALVGALGILGLRRR